MVLSTKFIETINLLSCPSSWIDLIIDVVTETKEKKCRIQLKLFIVEYLNIYSIIYSKWIVF